MKSCYTASRQVTNGAWAAPSSSSSGGGSSTNLKQLPTGTPEALLCAAGVGQDPPAHVMHTAFIRGKTKLASRHPRQQGCRVTRGHQACCGVSKSRCNYGPGLSTTSAASTQAPVHTDAQLAISWKRSTGPTMLGAFRGPEWVAPERLPAPANFPRSRLQVHRPPRTAEPWRLQRKLRRIQGMPHVPRPHP